MCVFVLCLYVLLARGLGRGFARGMLDNSRMFDLLSFPVLMNFHGIIRYVSG